jgi:hypothetical protein
MGRVNMAPGAALVLAELSAVLIAKTHDRHIRARTATRGPHPPGHAATVLLSFQRGRRLARLAETPPPATRSQQSCQKRDGT